MLSEKYFLKDNFILPKNNKYYVFLTKKDLFIGYLDIFMVKRVIYASKNDINQKMDVNFHEKSD